MRLTWRKQPSEGGLRSIGQSPRGAILKMDGEDIGRVTANRVGWQRWMGWYWIAVSADGRVPLSNSCAKPAATIDDAKAECLAYVKRCLAAAEVVP